MRAVLHNLFQVLVEATKPKREPFSGYTHWDIHALARTIAPAAWEAYDARPEPKYYMENVIGAENFGRFQSEKFEIGTYDSFHLAVNALLAGYKAPWGHLWSDDELSAWVESRKDSE